MAPYESSKTEWKSTLLTYVRNGDIPSQEECAASMGVARTTITKEITTADMEIMSVATAVTVADTEAAIAKVLFE